MELIKKNIHMDRMKCKASTQITLEDDVIVPDSKPDADKIIQEKGWIQLEQVKPISDYVTVKGKLCFSVLYVGDGDEKRIYNLEGAISFEEQVYLEGVTSSDNVCIKEELEDLRIGFINPRKISIKSILNIKLQAEEAYQLEAGVDFGNNEPVEIRKKNVDLVQTAMEKKDIYRIHHEIELPGNLPNIFQIVWNEVALGEMEFRAMEDKISMQGEVRVFLLYEGEGDDMPIRWYEVNIPCRGEIDCQGSRDTMIADISYAIDHVEFEAKPDFDGEERLISMDLVCGLHIKLLEEERIEFLADAYGIATEAQTKELVPVFQEVEFKCLLMKTVGKHRISERIKLNNNSPHILQICHSEGVLQIEQETIVENGIELEGFVQVKVMYITGEDDNPFACIREMVPFTYLLEVPAINYGCQANIRGRLEQIQVVMAESDELDVKILLSFDTVILCGCQEKIMTEVESREIDRNAKGELPSMVAYIAASGESLWDIGKRYCVPIGQIRENNGISGEIKQGDKILVMKAM